MYKKYVLIFIFLGFLNNYAIAEQVVKNIVNKENLSVLPSEVVNDLKRLEKEREFAPFKKSLCNTSFEFLGAPNSKAQTLKLSKQVSMDMEQNITVRRSKYGAKIVTNVICQKLIGGQYTGSQQEWAQFIKQAANGVIRSGGKDVRLELLGGDAKYFHQDVEHKEYKFTGKINNIKQDIYNLAVLDKRNNTVITFSVSGAEKGKKAVLAEYKRILNSIKIEN